MAGARGMSGPDLIGVLIDLAEDEELFASHAEAYEILRTDHPDLLREIDAEDGAWERSDLSAPLDEARSSIRCGRSTARGSRRGGAPSSRRRAVRSPHCS